MEIPMNAEVSCVDGPCGHSVCVIIDPVKDRVTHFVVRENALSETQRIVPIDQIIESNPHFIRLYCTHKEFENMPTFVETEFIPSSISGIGMDSTMLWPYTTPEFGYITLEHERIPPNELEVRRGASVEAKDGRVGKVDEFLVDSENGDITHLVLREGHMWGQKDVTIPVGQIDYLEENVVHLKIDKKSIDALPSIPIRQVNERK
jgi:sporulation protein YlmC with PRC-barrel domain